MSRRCELTAKGPMVGNKVSHSNIKTKRRFLPNLCNVTFISDALGRNVRLRVSTNAIKSVDHRGGFDAFMIKAKADVLSPRALLLKKAIEKKIADDCAGGAGELRRSGESLIERTGIWNGRVERPGRFSLRACATMDQLSCPGPGLGSLRGCPAGPKTKNAKTTPCTVSKSPESQHFRLRGVGGRRRKFSVVPAPTSLTSQLPKIEETGDKFGGLKRREPMVGSLEIDTQGIAATEI